MFTPLEKAVLDMMLDKPGEEFKTARQQLHTQRFASETLAVLGFYRFGRVHRRGSPTRFAEYGD
jgi:hypothetical protein